MALKIGIILVFWTGIVFGSFSNTFIYDRLGDMFSDTSFISKAESFIYKESSIYSRRTDVKKSFRANSDINHEVVFAVKQNLEDLTTLVNDISNPFSNNYGKHLSWSEVNTMTSNSDSRSHIVSYLSLQGIAVDQSTVSSDYIKATAPISKWEAFFNTEFFEFEMDTLSNKLLRCIDYSLPENIHAHVSTVFNTIQFPQTAKQSYRSPIPSELQQSLMNPGVSGPGIVNGYTTPALINAIYNIQNNTGSMRASQAVFEELNELYSPSDLTLFQEVFALPIQSGNDIGGHTTSTACTSACSEGNLDIQYIMAIAQGVNTTYYYYTGDSMLHWLMDVHNMTNPPKVMSISWGGPELFHTESEMTQFNTEALKLAAMGVTLVASSGDDGAMDNLLMKGNPANCAYYPSFPSVSPFVTSVGATMGPESSSPEVVCQSNKNGLITSGGGFSSVFETPVWQQSSVRNYLSTNSPYQGFNRNGRGYPDVAAIGSNYLVVQSNTFAILSGTSASCPVFAAMVSLVNSKRILQGKSTLGWINPSLYALSASFTNDITKGDNNCINNHKACCAQGFNASKGWDPVTGLGSVDYAKFEKTFVGLGNHPNIPTKSPTPLPGSPTISPALNPTAVPSVAPTPELSMASGGWVYGTYYSEGGCMGEKVRVEGYKIGTCFPAGSKFGFSIYFQFSCDTDKVNGVLNIYSDKECQNILETRLYGIGCSSADQYYYYGETTFSLQMECTPAEELPLDPQQSYIVNSFGTTRDSCVSGEFSTFTAYLQDYCYYHAQHKPPFSDKFEYVVLSGHGTVNSNIYTTSDCSGIVMSSTSHVLDECAAVPYAVVNIDINQLDEGSMFRIKNYISFEHYPLDSALIDATYVDIKDENFIPIELIVGLCLLIVCGVLFFKGKAWYYAINHRLQGYGEIREVSIN